MPAWRSEGRRLIEGREIVETGSRALRLLRILGAKDLVTCDRFSLPAPIINNFMKKIIKIAEAQDLVKNFANGNKWSDEPNIDKFDHLHEELIEMSKHLRYKSSKEMKEYIKADKDIFEDGIGDLFFGLCRLSNQLGVDVTKAFNLVSERIVAKYKGKKDESKHVQKK